MIELADQAKLPWRDLTTEWNRTLDEYRTRKGRHWHGTMPGSRSKEFPRGRDQKSCVILVVVDSFQGEPIDLANWRGYPDYYDFTRIIALPLDHYFAKRKFVLVEDHLEAHVRRLVDLHNATLTLPATPPCAPSVPGS